MATWSSDTNKLEEKTITQVFSNTRKVHDDGNLGLLKFRELRFGANAGK